MAELSRVEKLRINASKGGKKTAQKGPDFLEDRARKGGEAVVRKYGSEYFAHQLHANRK